MGTETDFIIQLTGNKWSIHFLLHHLRQNVGLLK